MDNSEHRDFGFIFWVHFLFIILVYTSPFWLSWKIIPLGAVVIALQGIIFGGCLLTKLEFGESEHNNFNWYYLNALGFKASLKSVKIWTDYLGPIFVFALAVIWQVVLGHESWL